jgi:hypothetical protein
LTAHWIDKYWKLHATVLRCEHFPGEHKAPLIVAKVEKMLGDLRIALAKVNCCVTDNEPTNNAAADLMAFDWAGCIDHIIELITGKAFEDPSVRDMMARARKIVGHFSSSNQELERLKKLQQALKPGVTPLTVIQDVITRWWSTCSMGKRLILLRACLDAMQLDDPSSILSLTEEQWELLITTVTVLDLFMQLQIFFEGEKYVSISFIPSMVYLMRGKYFLHVFNINVA